MWRWFLGDCLEKTDGLQIYLSDLEAHRTPPKCSVIHMTFIHASFPFPLGSYKNQEIEQHQFKCPSFIKSLWILWTSSFHNFLRQHNFLSNKQSKNLIPIIAYKKREYMCILENKSCYILPGWNCHAVGWMKSSTAVITDSH